MSTAAACIDNMSAEKKQVPLRLNRRLYDQLARWAEDDFRSLNGQIEYLLTKCVRQRQKSGRPIPTEWHGAGQDEND